MKRTFLILALVSILSTACGTLTVRIDTGDATPTFTPWITPTPTTIADFPTPPPTFTTTPWDVPLPGPTPTPVLTMPGAFVAAYDREGIVFGLANDGSTYPLSPGDSLFSFPIVSPDGRWVAYLHYLPNESVFNIPLRDVMLASADGSYSPRVIVGQSTDSLVAFSPDSQWLLTSRAWQDGDSGFIDSSLHALNAFTGEDRQIAGPISRGGGRVSMPATGVRWAPNSRFIFYNSIDRCGLCPSNGDLWLADIVGTTPRLILGEDEAGGLTFSPNGDQLLAAGRDRLVLLQLGQVYDSSQTPTPRTLLEYPRREDDPLRFALPEIHWVENGSRVRAAVPSTEAGVPVLKIWEIPVQSENVSLAIYPNLDAVTDLAPYPHSMLPAMWTENMTRMAINVSAGEGDNKRCDILMADEFGREPVEFLHNARFINWSPDALHFIFIIPKQGSTGNELDATREVYLGRADNAGAARMLLPQGTGNIILPMIRWLDGNSFLFQTIEPDGSQQLWRETVDGSVTRLK